MPNNFKEYKQYVRKYATCDVLEYFAYESLDIFKNNKNGIKEEKIDLINKKHKIKIGSSKMLITQWGLLETIYNSIIYGNDHRNKVINRKDFYNLFNMTSKNSEMLEDGKNIKKENIIKHLSCIANMQFDFENMTLRSDFNRIYHIMMIINKDKKYDQSNKVCYIDFETKFEEITKFNYKKFLEIQVLLLVLSINNNNCNLINLIDGIEINNEKYLNFSKNEMINVLSYISKDYHFYRNIKNQDKNIYNWNILKYNPIVHCDKNDKYIVSNFPSYVLYFSKVLYWTIRNYYNDNKSRDFTSYFGHCFEFYLDDFFNRYSIEHKKIEEDNNKKPDWIIETEEFTILIEQKAGTIPISTRTIIDDKRFVELDEYINKNIVKAFKQLYNYKTDTPKIIIRICLMFEQLYFTEDLQDLALSRCEEIDAKEKYLYWVISINDFEKLFLILNKNEKEFNNIINTKILLEKSKNKNGRGFDRILYKYKNEYVLEKIDYYDKIINDMKQKLKYIV